MVEPLTDSHVDAVAALHLRSLTGLLRDLGSRAIRAFYRGAVQSECAVGFAYLEQGELGGFVFGSTNPRQLRRDILGNSLWGTLLGTSVGVVRRPSTLLSLWSNFVGTNAESYDPQAAELTYLAVDEKHRTAGVGRRLVERFDLALRESEIPAYELSVDADNLPAIGFYERLGFALIHEYSEFGILHKRYRKNLI